MEEAALAGQVAAGMFGHRFGHQGLDGCGEQEVPWEVGLRNRKNRCVLEPGGLNVERVRALLHGDACPGR